MTNLKKLTMLSILGFIIQISQAQIYLHDFGSVTISGSPYSVAPVSINGHLSNSSWASSTGSFIDYAGSSGQALSLSNSSGTPTYTLTFDVASGYKCSIDSFGFWRQRSTTGAQNWTLSISSTQVGSGTVPTSGSSTGKTAVSAAAENLTGTVTVVLSLSGASGTGTYRLDDFALYGSVDSIVVTQYDTTSQVHAPATQVASSTPSSLADSVAEAFDVFRFTIKDSATGDNKATRLTRVRLFPAAANTADWTDHIAGVALNDGSAVTIGTPTLTDAQIDIPITVGNLDILDGALKNITVSVYLRQSNLTDNAVLAFKIDADNHGFTSDTSGSELMTVFNGGTDITGNSHTISVTASKLGFAQQPSQIAMGVAMTPAVTVESVDANGNRDTDYSTNIQITSTGSLSGSPVVSAPASGLATFSTLTHTAVASGRQFTAKSGTLDSALSVTFNIITPPQNGLSIAAVNALYSITFDGAIDGILGGQFAGSGIVNGQQSGKLNSLGWSVTGMSDGNVPFGGNNSSGDFAMGTSTGGVSTGGMYAFQVSSGNYALGFQPTGTDFAPGEVILKIQNNTGDTIRTLQMAFDWYVYNDQGRSTQMEVYFSPDNAVFTKNDTLTLATDAASMASGSWRRNYFTQRLSGLTLLNGSYYYIKWRFADNGGSGSRDEFAIDNIAFVGYKDSVGQTAITSQLSGALNSLIINGAGQTEVSGNMTVYKELKFFKGHLQLNNYNLTLGDENTDASIIGAGTSSFIIPGTGTLRYYVNNATGTYLFPYGTTDEYTPAEVVFSSATLAGTDYLESALSNQKHPNFAGYVINYIARNWTIDASGITSPVYELTLQYVDDDVEGDESSILPVKYSGGTWTAPSNINNNNVDTVGLGSVNTSSNQLIWAGLTGFSIFGGAGNGTPLPVELIRFSAVRHQGDILVNWTTATERNTAHFVVEKAIDSGDFESIQTVSASGNSNIAHNYQTSDGESTAGVCYYRLRMVDLDGNYVFSKIVSVSGTDREPNPFHAQLVKKGSHFYLKLEGKYGASVEVSVWNVHGEMVRQTTTDIQPDTQLALDFLNGSTLHFVRVRQQDEIRVLKVPVH